MTRPDGNVFSARGTAAALETGQEFQPKFDGEGLIPAIVTDAVTGAVLMFAHMTAQALTLTLTTSEVHFWSRSRAKIWKKGEDSGNVLSVREIMTDCDQDVLWIKAAVQGQGVACHTGAKSCFYRRLVSSGGTPANPRLEFIAPQQKEDAP
jgi:phosphoribosyl-AMP cyclohydrolase